MTTVKLLGIDIGTTGVRATVFTSAGAVVADANEPWTFASPHAGWAEADADAWWAATQRVLAKLPLGDVDAVAVVGQAPTAVLLDKEGQCTGPAILWLDTRAEAEAAELGVQSYYLGPKLKWLERAGALADVATVAQSHAFITYRLTGQLATDPSTAALCLPLFDLATKEWTSAERMPPVRPAHAVIGGVTANVGLRAGVPVVVGGGDFAAATLGAGVVAEGEACLMLGTAGNLLVPRSTPGTDRRLINAHHVGRDVWLSLGGTLSGGAMEWLRRALGGADHATLEAEAAAVAPGADALLFLPYLQGERTPIWDAEARGTFVGLGLNHTRAHLWRALLEGIALSFVDCQQVLADDGATFTEVVAADGGGKSALFRQILCDALGVPLSYTPVSGGTVGGAAILAGQGIGAITNPKSWRGESIRHTPNAEAHATYRELLPIRRAAYTGMRPVFSNLAALRK